MTDEMKPKKSKSNIPQAEADLISVATLVADTWQTRPDLTLIWADPPGMKKTIETFKASFVERNELKGSRAIITQTLKEINAEINQSLKHVKSYIAELYTVNKAPTYYAQFGIVKKNKVYRIPADNDNRFHSLGQMVKAISEHGLDDRIYGKAYWEDIYNRFSEAKVQASETDSSSSGHVSVKSGQKPVIRKTLNALIHIIKGNYPDSWKEELRVWGFQKNKY